MRSNRWVWVLLGAFLIALIFASYQYYSYFKQYEEYYGKFKFEESEKQRYIALYNTETANKNAEIEQRRRAEVKLAETQATMQSQAGQIASLKGTLSDEQQTRQSLQSSLSGTTAQLGQTQQQLDVLSKQAGDIRNELNFVSTWIRAASHLPSNMKSSVDALAGSALSSSGDVCVVDARKIGTDMESSLGFEYDNAKLDRKVEAGYSWYYDLDTFWQSKAGVCVDFAIFAAARVRSELDAARAHGCSRTFVKFSDAASLACPCYAYSVGGRIRGADVWHMVTAVSPSGDPLRASFADFYCFEPQNGNFLGRCDQYFDPLRDVLSADDFVGVIGDQRQSVSDVQNKISRLVSG